MDIPQYTTEQYHIIISLWYKYDLQECIDTVVFGNKSKCEEEFAKNARRSSLYITRDSRESQLSSSALDTYHQWYNRYRTDIRACAFISKRHNDIGSLSRWPYAWPTISQWPRVNVLRMQPVQRAKLTGDFHAR